MKKKKHECLIEQDKSGWYTATCLDERDTKVTTISTFDWMYKTDAVTRALNILNGICLAEHVVIGN